MKTITFHPNKTDKITLDFSKLPKQFSKHFYEYIKEKKDGKKSVDSTLMCEYTYFSNYIAPFFAKQGLNSFSEITLEKKQLFLVYLNTRITKRNKNLLSHSTKRHILGSAKTYFTWLAMRHPDEAPMLALFSPNPFSRGTNNNLKTKAIDETVMEQIKNALRYEENPYIKTFITIAVYLGLRREDILELRADCLLDDPDKTGAYLIHYYNHKDASWKKKPIPKNCSSAVITLKLLKEYTHKLREEAADERLFLWKVQKPRHGTVGSIRRFTAASVKSWLKIFTNHHNVLDAKGESPKITSHMFRHTLLTSMDEAGVDVEHARHMADHKHAFTTQRYYIHSRDATYNQQMDELDNLVESITIAGNVNVIKDDAFHVNQNSLRLSDGYCTDVKMAAEVDYICTHYQKRGNCYGCSKLLTTPEFLPSLHEELQALEHELSEKSLYGENVLRQIHFRIELIKILIKRLEDLKEDEA